MIETKFKLVSEEMKRRHMQISTNTPLYKKVYKEVDKSMLDKILNSRQDIVVVPGYVRLVGSSVHYLEGNKELPNDIDILIRDEGRHEGLEVQLTKLLPKKELENWHFVYDPQGAHDDSIPLYNLVLVPVKDPKVEKVQKETVKPLTKLVPLKTSGGYNKQAFFDLKDAWNFWAQGYIPDPGIVVEEKFDGFRCIAEYDGKNTLIYFEDSKQDRSKLMPNLVADLKAIGKPVILDGEYILIDKSTGDKIARKNMMVLLGSNPDMSKYDYVLETFDILYYDGQDLTKKPWFERKQILNDLFVKKDFKALRELKSNIAKTKDEFFAFSEKVRKIPDSEGAFYKVYNSTYPLNGKTPLWAKMKNIKEIHGVVLEVNEVK